MPTPSNDAAFPGQVILHYQVEERLGEGGMGVVFKALDLRLKRHVALKFLASGLHLDASHRERLMREAMAASALDHPNIGAVHALEETSDGRIFIVMGFYPGGTLKDRLAYGSLGNAEAVEIALQAARGLAGAYSRGIIHRDIKPSNLILTPEGIVKIVDFGIAKFTGGTDITQTGTVMGTASYMSPEQATSGAIDARTDIWSLGVVLYEMLRGDMPFRGDTIPALMYQVVHEPPPPLTGRPEALQRLVRRCLEKDPRLRYATAEELATDLERLKNHLASGDSADTVVMPPPPTPSFVTLDPPGPKGSSGRWLAALAVAGGVIGLAAWLWTEYRGEPTLPSPPPKSTPVSNPVPSGPVPSGPPPSAKTTNAIPPSRSAKQQKAVARGPVSTPYTGPKEGRIVWTGDLDAGQDIDLGAKEIAGVVSGTFPGVPVSIEVHPNTVKVVTPPGPANQWRHVVLRSDGKKQLVVVINWTLNPP